MSVYDYYKEHQSPSPSPKPGTFWMYARVDFSKQNMGINDDIRLFQVRDKWMLLRGFSRCVSASGVANTLDIGTAQNGTELDTAFNANSAGDWTIMDTLKSGGEIALTSDGYIWLDNNTAAASSGVCDFLIEVLASPYDAEFDSLAE